MKTRIAAVAGAVALASASWAADGTWTGTTGGNWSDGTKWSGGVADGVGSLATISPLITNSTLTITVDSAKTIGNLTVNNTGSNNVFTISGSGANTLTWDTSSNISTIKVVTARLTNLTFDVELAGDNTMIFTNNATSTIQFNKTSTMSGPVFLYGGRYNLTASNSLGSGAITLANNANHLYLGHTNALGSGTVTIGAPGSEGPYFQGASKIYNNVVVSNSFTVWQNQFYGTVTIDATSQVTDFNSGTGDGFYGQIVNNASFTAAGNNPMYIRGTDSNTGSGLWIASSSSATAGLALYKTNAIAIPGNVEVRAGSSVRLYGVGGNQIADTSVVNLLTNGVFHLNGLAEGVGIVTSRATAAVIQLGTGGTLTNGLSNVSGLYMGSIAGTGAVIQAGSGMWTLQGNSTYRGSMEVASGGLIVDAGASLAMTSLTVGASGTLGGSGTISNFFSTGLDMTIVSGGKLAPGTSPGTMTLNLGTGSLDVSGVGAQALEFELGTNSSDQVSMLTGTLKIGSGVLGFNEFKFTDLTFIPKNTTFTLFSLNDTAASLSGTLDAADKTGTFGGGAYTGTLGVSGNDITLTVIPEPATLGTVGLGALAMLILRRARKQK